MCALPVAPSVVLEPRSVNKRAPVMPRRHPNGHDVRRSSMLALTTLNAGWQTFFFATALILFVLHGIGFDQRATRLRFDGLGLAVFVSVFFWNALAAT